MRTTTEKKVIAARYDNLGIHNKRNALQIPEKINRNDPNNDRNALQKSEKNNRSAMIIRNSRIDILI